MRQFREIKLNDYPGYYYAESGSEAFICKDPEILKKITTREGVCLKIFFKPIDSDIFDYVWGRPFPIITTTGPRLENSKFYDSIRIQNLAARKGLAARIYELVILDIFGHKFPALVTDYVKRQGDEKDREDPTYKINNDIGPEYGFHFKFTDDNNKLNGGSNFPQGKLVDFEGSEFDDDYETRLLERFKTGAVWSDQVYQSVPELGLEAWRDETKRIELLQLAELNFEGITVWDIGTSGGYYARLADKSGAARVLAFDLPSVAEAAFEMSNYFGFFNIDFIGRDLIRDPIQVENYPAPDLIFYLSVQRYFGTPDYLFKAKVVIYEHNGDEPDTEIIKRFHRAGFNSRILGESSNRDARRLTLFSRERGGENL